jgi:beta-N-acetylhexosaminidase
VIGTRSFGDDPEWVGTLGVALIKGLQDQGVLATAKHFPGHGDTCIDSHYATPIVKHNEARLNQVELKPFRMAISAGVQAILTAHVTYAALDPDYPVTLSSKVLTEFLRRELGFTRLLITDAMDMHAVTRFGVEQSIERALEAGSDLILLAHLEDQLDLAERFSSYENPQAVERIMAAQRLVPKEIPPLGVVGSRKHLAVAQEIADRSITVVRDENQQIPLRLTPDTQLGVVSVQPENLTPADTSATVSNQLAERISERHRKTIELVLSLSPSENEIREILDRLKSVDRVIISTISAEQYTGQAHLIQELSARGESPIVVSLRTPYDIIVFPEITTYICAYSIRAATIEAIVRVLFGEIPAVGVLPCTIPGITPQYPGGIFT